MLHHHDGSVAESLDLGLLVTMYDGKFAWHIEPASWQVLMQQICEPNALRFLSHR